MAGAPAAGPEARHVGGAAAGNAGGSVAGTFAAGVGARRHRTAARGERLAHLPHELKSLGVQGGCQRRARWGAAL
jgi:hypothetical protein